MLNVAQATQQCNDSLLTDNMGDVDYLPDFVHGRRSQSCQWKFSFAEKKEFLLVLQFHELQAYGAGDSVQLPDGNRCCFTVFAQLLQAQKVVKVPL